MWTAVPKTLWYSVLHLHQRVSSLGPLSLFLSLSFSCEISFYALGRSSFNPSARHFFFIQLSPDFCAGPLLLFPSLCVKNGSPGFTALHGAVWAVQQWYKHFSWMGGVGLYMHSRRAPGLFSV